MVTKEFVEQRFIEFANFMHTVNSDTASVKEMTEKIYAFRDSLEDSWERELFDDVAFDYWMVDTEVQVKRRMSGELDAEVGGQTNLSYVPSR